MSDYYVPRVIDAFRGDYRFLSNFYAVRIVYEGNLYVTLEHAYQAAKAASSHQRWWVANAPNPATAKTRGRQVGLRADWEEVKLDIMLALLRIKFKDDELKMKLQMTGTAQLIEGNYWGDTFWGICRGKGENHLGKLLMKVRQEIRDGKS